MKKFYSTALALLLTMSAFAQDENPPLVQEGFTTSPYEVKFSLRAGTWVISTSEPNGEGGNYLVTDIGTGSRSVTSKPFTPVASNKLYITWYERKTTTTNIFRSLSYRVIEDGVFFPLTETSDAVSTNWIKKTVILHTDDIMDKEVELLWNINRPAGTTAHYSMDDIHVTTSWEPVPTAPLPVELASFGGYIQKSSSTLNWSTASEENNDKFFVERSADGKNFRPIGQVKGSGNSAVTRNYSFTDNAPVVGVNYYRLRQVDFNGTIAYSNVVVLEGTAKGVQVSLYPTVASNTVKVNLQNTSGSVSLNVTDITGRTIATITDINEREIELPVQKFKSGVYFVRVTDGQNQQVQRFIKE